MTTDIKLTIGVADITIDGLKVPNQADAATFTAEPILTQVDLYTAPNYDQILEGWNVELKVVCDEDTFKGIQMALPGVETILESTTEVGIKDGKGLQSLRSQAKEIVIHPANLPESDESFDITIFKAVPVGTYERVYGKDKTTYEITYKGLHKTGDHKKSGNYFLIGEDPLAV
jgi:hypothetical protein